jgi:ABC-type enterochelin transport system substrate-binding protein
MNRSKMLARLLLVASVAALLSSAYAQDVIHAVEGVVTHVDKKAKSISIKTAEGSEEVFAFGEHTAVRDSRKAEQGAKMGIVDSYFAGKEGSHVVVRYMGKGSDKTAMLLDDFGKDSLKVGRGTVTHVDRAARTVAIKTENGGEATYKLGSEGVVETDHGVVRANRYLAKEGDKVVVHYTEDEGGKLVRFFKKI